MPGSGIVEEIAQAGPGARGIVIGARGRSGHAFNVVNIEGDVVFLNGQTGHAKNVGSWGRFFFMRTK
ncbi:toxin glutamine deamidase domain-containing protein [Streptomyces lasiicapitis]|uniref:toxin glutamine deamidase domain-containing protein n=1 Tax=Streptomyces lasiicapitis TaxID=1923961 RepID=UPI003570DF8D